MAGQMVELTDVGTLLDQQAIIRYHFWDEDGVADPAVLVSDYVTDVLPVLRVFQNQAYVHKLMISRIVYPTAELQVETPINPNIAGAETGDPEPGSVTYSVKWTLGTTVHLAVGSTKHIKRGGKHIGGCDSGDVSGNSIVAFSTINGLVGDYVDALMAILSDSWQLVVGSFTDDAGDRQTTIQKYAPVTAYVLQGIGSQVSRKPSHGA
jgi:hypothetical protein